MIATLQKDEKPSNVVDTRDAPHLAGDSGVMVNGGPKYIFLGIGGVLSTLRSKTAVGQEGTDNPVLDKVGAELIQRLQQDTGAKVVLASRFAHRERFDVKDYLAVQGFAPVYADDWRTPLGEQTGSKHLDFAAPIYSYCMNHHIKPEEIVVLANNPRSMVLPEFKARVIPIDSQNGISLQNFEQARHMLNSLEPYRGPII